MALIVQKFGGSSVANADRVRNVARIITETYRKGHSVVVVLSAQGDTTDDLIAKAAEINPHASKREMDMLLATGEQISISLCAMAIEAMGYQVVSLTGWQAGVNTDSAYGGARIKRIQTERIQTELDKRKIVLVAGFQGINKYGDVTTLGRGGSDTSAVALAAALHADLCQIYTDVDGVYTADPRSVQGARKLEEITFENDDLAECDESEQVQSESSACWELRQIIRDAPFPLKDQNDAAEELERLAEQSDLHAQYLMGLLYRDGLLLIPDSQSAKYWLTQAAKQGLPEAQYALDKLLSLTILKSVIRTGASAA